MLAKFKAAFDRVVDLLHTYPAAASYIASAIVTLVGRWGFHWDASQVATVLLAVNAVLYGWVHHSVVPMARFKKGL
jgi:hypothetical protein